jgi:DNA-directed RNA polymerase subunit RPC12/RpoP
MIRSKRTKITHNSRENASNSTKQDKDMRFMAYIKNYKCLFCQKTMFIQSFESVKCNHCNSQWFEKLPDKKAKTVQAI